MGDKHGSDKTTSVGDTLDDARDGITSQVDHVAGGIT
jgi:hypothetical protein